MSICSFEFMEACFPPNLGEQWKCPKCGEVHETAICTRPACKCGFVGNAIFKQDEVPHE